MITSLHNTEPCLGIDDLNAMLKELFTVRTKWRRLGLELDFTADTLDDIEQTYQQFEDRLERVLTEWLKRGSATWRQLVDALSEDFLNETQLAEKLREKYCPTETCLRLSDLKVVLKEVLEVRAKWWTLGLELYLTTDTLDDIQQRYSEPEDQLERVLIQWLKRGSATWQQLVVALSSEFLDETRFAEKLREKYCPSD